MLYVSLSERDIFSVETAHVSKKEEQHCFCEHLWTLNISGIPRDSDTGDHLAASDAEYTHSENMHSEKTVYEHTEFLRMTVALTVWSSQAVIWSQLNIYRCSHLKEHPWDTVK